MGPFVSLRHLKFILGKIDTPGLTDLLSKADTLHYTYIKRKKKPDGTIKEREISPSVGLLKVAQINLKKFLNHRIVLPDNIHGGVPGKSTVTHTDAHKGNKHFFYTDLEKFYPSISSRRVYNALVDQNFSPDISRILTKLVTYKGHVPQGAPTSNVISNIVFLPIDRQLRAFCKKHGITYTRYVDDLLFSSPKPFLHSTGIIIGIIISAGFMINRGKTGAKIGPTENTGIMINNNGLDIGRKTMRKYIQAPKDSKLKKSLRGYRKYVTKKI